MFELCFFVSTSLPPTSKTSIFFQSGFFKFNFSTLSPFHADHPKKKRRRAPSDRVRNRQRRMNNGPPMTPPVPQARNDHVSSRRPGTTTSAPGPPGTTMSAPGLPGTTTSAPGPRERPCQLLAPKERPRQLQAPQERPRQLQTLKEFSYLKDSAVQSDERDRKAKNQFFSEVPPYLKNVGKNNSFFV